MKNIELDWRADNVARWTAEQVENRIGLAARYIEQDARRRLEAIADPEWGRGYRTQIVGRLLTSFVERAGKNILGHVGVRVAGGQGGEYHGYYIELGSSTAPAHPWLRPALLENRDAILSLFRGNGG